MRKRMQILKIVIATITILLFAAEAVVVCMAHYHEYKMSKTTFVKIQTFEGYDEIDTETVNVTLAERATEETTENVTVKVEVEVEETDGEATQFTETNPGFPELASEEYLLAQIIFCEAGGTSTEEMRLCGAVVLNRVRSHGSDFGKVNTVKEVLYQYEGTRLQQYDARTISKIEDGIVPSEDAAQVAHKLIYGELDIIREDILYQFGPYEEPWDGIERVYPDEECVNKFYRICGYFD